MDKKEKLIFKTSIFRCPECGSTNLIRNYETGEIICANCGLVISEQEMDKGPEWRSYNLEEEKSRARVGPPKSFSFPDKGLTTEISPFDFDTFRRPLSPSARSQVWRLRWWQKRQKVDSSIERNLIQAMPELHRLADKLYIPPESPIREKAAIIYRRALKKGLIRGREIIGLVPAALYIACRMLEIQRTLQEVANASLASKKDVSRYYRLLLRELNIQMPVPDAIKPVSKIAGKLGISQKTQGRAIEILHQAREKHMWAGKNRVGLAGAALYIACLESNGEKENNRYGIRLRGLNRSNKTQYDIAKAAGVTTVTIRNRYKELVEGLGLEVKSK